MVNGTYPKDKPQLKNYEVYLKSNFVKTNYFCLLEYNAPYSKINIKNDMNAIVIVDEENTRSPDNKPYKGSAETLIRNVDGKPNKILIYVPETEPVKDFKVQIHFVTGGSYDAIYIWSFVIVVCICICIFTGCFYCFNKV